MIDNLMVSLAVATASLGGVYGEHLLDLVHRQHPEIRSMRIEAVDQGRPIDLQRRWSEGRGASEKETLLDANGNEIGTITLQSRCSRLAPGGNIAASLSRRIYSAASLSEPDPFVPGAVRAAFAQRLIDETLARDPTIITLAFHVTAPGAKLNTIVASSFGRIGKPGDKDDEAVIQESKTLREVTNKGKRLAVELPLRDSHGSIIGALSTSFRMEPGAEAGEIEKRAVALRDELARRTPSLEALFRPVTASSQVRALRTCNP